MTKKTKYKMLIQYNDDGYEKLVVSVNKYISEIKTEYLGEMMITTDDIKDMEKGSDLIPTIDRELYAHLDYNTRLKIEDYIVNMYSIMDSVFLYGIQTFTGIEILEIEEEE